MQGYPLYLLQRRYYYAFSQHNSHIDDSQETQDMSEDTYVEAPRKHSRRYSRRGAIDYQEVSIYSRPEQGSCPNQATQQLTQGGFDNFYQGYYGVAPQNGHQEMDFINSGDTIPDTTHAPDSGDSA
ncbi:hypothetical protein SLS55_009955 [Diplodia seriata]|uniref:Uncharacterized protein n=1 Tax=Diplodia seriata TaxID=420778 RepID=A0ABR3C1H2_9PEZI